MRPPNVLLLLSDEHSFRFLGHVPREEGGEPAITPNLDRLAARGTVFTDAYCQMPLCTPSRLSLLTGREVRGCGAWGNESVLRPELPTVASVLGAAGYETCLVGKMHLGGRCQSAGFGHRPYGDLTGKCGHQWEPLGDRALAHGMRGRTLGAGVTEIPESLIQDEVVAHESVAWIREHRAARPGRPWFLCAGFSRPHFPLTAPRRWIERYPPGAVSEPRVPASGDAWDHPMSAGMRRGFRADEVTREETMRARQGYFACVSYLDEVVGDLLLRLEADGALRDTLVVYTTDHGEMAGEHGVWWKNGWYEACTRVPLIVSLPEQRRARRPAAARRVRTPVGLVDLLPTLAALGGAAAPPDADGVDLSAALRGAAEPPDRPIVCDSLTPRWGPGTEFRMVRRGRLKYVRFRAAPPLAFDLAADPGEQRNLLARGTDGATGAALAELAGFAETTMDFDAAERERTVRDGDLPERYRLAIPRGTGNAYRMPSGRLVNADDALYDPTVLAESADAAIGPDAPPAPPPPA